MAHVHLQPPQQYQRQHQRHYNAKRKYISFRFITTCKHPFQSYRQAHTWQPRLFRWILLLCARSLCGFFLSPFSLAHSFFLRLTMPCIVYAWFARICCINCSICNRNNDTETFIESTMILWCMLSIRCLLQRPQTAQPICLHTLPVRL